MAGSEADVLVAGGGPSGLMMALELAERGIRCRIVDKLPERSDKSRALVVQARTMELFQRHGFAAELLERGRKTVEISAFVKGRPAFELSIGDIGVEDTPFPFVLFVSQAETEKVLEGRLERLGMRVERPVELTGYTQHAEGALCRLRHGDGREEELPVRYLVGCDGAHSVVRKGAGLKFEGAAYPQDFVLADVELDWSASHERLHFFLARDGLLVVIPFQEPGLYRLIASRAGAPPGAGGDPTLPEFQQLFDQLSPLAARLHGPRWLARFRLHHRGVDRYRAGRAFVVGDAAHIHSPAGGQGMNTGLQDAANLGWKLALVLQGRAPDSLLDTYHEERHPVGRRLLNVTDRIFSIGASRRRWVLALRNFIVPRIAPWALANRDRRRRAFRFVSQLGIRYRQSSGVAEEGVFLGRPAAGERAPDAPLLRVRDGAAVSVFDALHGNSHHLLAFGGPDSTDWAGLQSTVSSLAARAGDLLELHLIVGNRAVDPAAPDTVHADPSGTAHSRYALSGPGLYLVRPDGYIGFRSTTGSPEALEAYLQRTFPRSLP